MDNFLKILSTTLTLIAWLIVLAIAWALAPWFLKLLDVVQKLHDWGVR